MTQRTLYLSNTGLISLTEPTAPASTAIKIDYDLHSFLGEDAVLDVAFISKKTTPALTDIVARLIWRDSLTDDVIYKVQGTLSTDESNTSSLWSVAGALEYFKSFEIDLKATALSAVLASDAYNALNSRGNKLLTINLPTDHPPSFDGDKLFKLLTTSKPTPGYWVLPSLTNLALYNAMYRVMVETNIPLDCELDPTLTVEQAIQLATSLDAQHHLVQLIWSPNVCRPRDAISLLGRKKPCHAIGQYMAMKTLRNAKTTAQGIPKIADPVAGESYPFTYKAMETRLDIEFDTPTLEELAKAKINVVRQIQYDTGTKFVLSDVLTQYSSKDSALRLVNSADIARYTTNRCIEILKRHMLKRTTAYLRDASRDITQFLDACVTAELLQNAEDLGGKPYAFSLIPDEAMPFERVRFALSRRPEGCTRTVVFDDDVLVK